MRTIVSRTKNAGAVLAALFVFSLSPTFNPAAAADQTAKPAVKKAAKTKAAQKPKSTQPKSSARVVVVSEDVVLATFDAFTIEWMKKLSQTEEFRKTQAQISESANGFSAEYTGYLPHRYIHIKKTDSSDTPYVGILTYYEKKLRCTAKTKEEALQGPFDQVDTSQVSEIFRFTKGKWVY